MPEVDPVILQLRADVAKYQSDMRQAAQRVQSSLGDQEQAIVRLESKMDAGFKRIGSSAIRGATALKSAIATIGLAALGAQAVETALRFQRFEKGLEVATGSTQAAGKEIEFLRGLADQLGVRFITLAENFTGVAAAARGTALEGQAARDVFESITRAIVATGGSTEQVNGALLAVQQIISKGTVSAEELRGQLGERLPGAFQIAARAMGVTTAELGKLLEQGDLASTDFLPRFAAQLGKELPANLQTADASFQRFQTALDDISNSTADGFMHELGEATDDLTDALKGMQQSGALEAIGSFLGDVIRLGGQAISVIGDLALAWKRWRLEVGIKQQQGIADGWFTSQADKQNARANAFRMRLDLDALNNPAKAPAAATSSPSPSTTTPPATSTGKSGTGKASKPPRSKLDPEAFAREEASLNDAILRLKADETRDAEARAAIETQRAESARVAANADVAADERLTAAQKAKIIGLNNQLASLEKARIALEAEAQAAKDALDLRLSALRNEEDLLQAQANLATTREERRDIELRLLDLAHQQERADLEAVIASKEATDAQKQIARARLAMLDALKGSQTEQINRQYESPIERRRREVQETAANMGDAIENIQLDALDRFTDGLANASTEFIKLGGIAGDVINGIISDMVRLAAQQAIFGSSGGGGILGALGGLFGGSGSSINSFSAALGASNSAALGSGIKIPGFAGGTRFAPGGLAIVGEDGPELVNLPRGSQVIPNDALAAARSMTGVSAATASGNSAGGTIKVQLMMDNDVFTARVQEASVPVAVETLRAAQPTLTRAAVSEVARLSGRMTL